MTKRGDTWAGGTASRLVSIAVTTVVALALLAPIGVAQAAPGVPGWYNPLPGTTVVDTAKGTGVAKGPIGAGVTRTVTIAGRGGVPSSGATAVDLLVRLTGATAATRVVLYPDGVTKPAVTSLHVARGQTATTTVTVPLSAAGKLRITNAAGKVQVAAAALGWYKEQPETQPTGAGFVPRTSTSLGTASLAPGRTTTFAVRGRGSVPTSATAVQLLLTATAGAKPLSITAWSASGSKPALASLTVPARRGRTTSLVVPLGTGGAAGKIKLTIAGAAAKVSLAHQGWFAPVAVGATGQRLTPVKPTLLADTATGLGVPRGKIGRGVTRTVTARGRATIPTNATGVVLGILATGATAATTLTAYPGNAGKPAPAGLTTAKGESVAGRVVVPLSPTGTLKLTNKTGSVHAQLVLEGYLTPYTRPEPPAPPAALPASVVEAARQLTTGTKPRQPGVAAGTLDESRVAVLTGSVTRSGSAAAVPGATVTVLDHPEYGSTQTAADGTFAMAVNGGTSLVVDVVKSGYLPVQRTTTVPWLAWQNVPAVAMTGLDPKSAVIQQDATAVQSVTSTRSVDDAGSRETSLLFEPGTEATMTLPDGSEKPLGDNMTVRATEFTTGPTGQAAMPGLLPFNTGFTYASEFSVDEALNAGATEVSFTKPVNTYVENFLDLAPGTTVPSGYYDRELGRWVAGPNGLVLEVVGEPNGVADLNLDADPGADPELYDENSIDVAERTKLAQLYDVGDTLWRVAVEHFTPWDYNYPYGPPPGAGPPPGGGGPDTEEESEERPCAAGGSVILCESQTLQETFPLAGTPLDLRYSSDAVPGRTAARTLRIRVKDGATGPLEDISVRVEVAGRSFEQNLDPAATGDFYSFTWDGLDAAGNPLDGTVMATVTVGYGYRFVYQEPQDFQNSFAQFGAGTLFRRGGGPASRPETNYIERTYTQAIGSTDARSLGNGGWSFDQVHRYDPEQRVLRFGDGRSISAANPRATVMTTLAGANQLPFGSATVRGLASGPDGSVYVADSQHDVVYRIAPDGALTTVAGGGSPDDGLGDGGPATDAQLEAPWDVAVALDGSLLIADTGDDRIRRVATDGTISTLAGGGSPADGVGDGVDAREARLSGPRGIAVSDAGQLYIADTGNDRVRMVSADGAIVTVAGGGNPGDGVGDGLPGPQAALELPVDVAVGDQQVYIADPASNRVRVLRVDGVLDTFAGDGTSGALVDGRPATESPLAAPSGVATTSTGNVYIADRLHNRIRRVTTTGTMVTAAGTGLGTDWWSSDNGDGALPTRASLSSPTAIAVKPDGALVISDTGNQSVRQAAASLPGLDATAYAIPSADGKELFAFDESGLHTDTLDARTGVKLLQFTYDAGGRLTSVKDHRGQVTTLERNAGGLLTAVVSPRGLRTTLTTDAQGWLSAIAEPGGTTIGLGHTAKGLLTSLTDRAGGVHQFEYDSLGLLTRDQAPGGAFTTLSGQDLEKGRKVTQTTATGRVRTVEITELADGSTRRTTVEPDGATVVVVTRTDGTVEATGADGVTVTSVLIPDQRWGSLVQVPGRVTVTQPNGQASTTTFDYETVLDTPGDPLSLKTWRRTATSPLGAVSEAYDAETRTTTRTAVDGVETVIVHNELGETVSTRRGSGPTTTFTYDALGRVVSSAQTASGETTRTTTFTYDSAGYLATVTDPAGGVTAYQRDPLGRTTRLDRPGGSQVGFTRDGEGRLTGVTPPGRTKHSIGVNHGRLASYDAPGGPSPEVTYGYDADGRLTSTTLPGGSTTTIAYTPGGRTASSSGPGLSVAWSYDDAGRVTGVDSDPGADLALGYDGYGLTDRLTWSGPVTGRVGLRRDADLRVTGVSIGDRAVVPRTNRATGQVASLGNLQFTYDADGLASGDSIGSVSSSLTRNGFDEPAALTWNAAGETELGQTDTRDALGRTVTRQETWEGGTDTLAYTYDAAGRLATVKRNGTLVEQYSYDANGNRTSQSSDGPAVTATFDGRDRILTLGSTTFTHDDLGRRTGRTAGGTTTTYSWSRAGHLTGASTTGGPAVGYVLDGLNQRVGRTVDGQLTDGYLYDDQRRLVGWTDGSGGFRAQFVYGDGPTPQLMVKGSTTYRFVTDHIGTVRSVVNVSTGIPAQRISYDSYGRVLDDTNPGFQPFGFAGGLTDPDTGLVHFDARDYDPETGRWMSPDPVGFDGTDPNLYAYVAGDPVNLTDPTGLFGFPGFDLPDIDFPDLPDIDFPSLSCLGDLVSTGLDLASNIPGPIGIAAGASNLALKCARGTCGAKDFADFAIGFVPGGKIAAKAYDLKRGGGALVTLGGAVGGYKAVNQGLGWAGTAGDLGGYAGDALSYR